MPNNSITNLDLLLRGASILACGGGLSFTEQTKLLKSARLQQALRNGITLLSREALKDNDVFATVSEIGAASAPVMDKSSLPKALQLLEKKTGTKIAGLIPGEIGQETITLEAAAILGLPIVDCDLSGCRAVPRLNNLALAVQGIPFTMSPLVVLQSSGEMVFVKQQKTLEQDEALVRKLVPAGQVVTMLGGCIRGKTIQTFLPYDSYSIATELGKSVLNGKLTPQVFPTPLLLGPVRFTITGIVEQESDGFNKKVVSFSSSKGQGSITVENEYMELQLNGQQFTFPQLIMLIDIKKKRGLHSSELKTGTKATLVVGDAFPFWKGNI